MMRTPHHVPRARRQPVTLSLVVLAFCGLLSTNAAAHFGQVTLNFKMGPYIPNIDSETNSSGNKVFPVYRCFFQNTGAFPPAGILPLPELDADMHLFDLFGSLEAGIGVAGTQARGLARDQTAYNERELAAGRCGRGGDTSVELSMLFIKPRLSYRFDALYDYLGIPLVPFARGALVGAGYFFTRNGAWDQQPLTDVTDTNTVGNLNPAGARLGFEAAVGLMIGLDWMDLPQAWTFFNRLPQFFRTGKLGKIPSSAKSTVVEHSYFFVEGVYSEIDSFRQPGLVLNPSTYVFVGQFPVMWNAGFAVELF